MCCDSSYAVNTQTTSAYTFLPNRNNHTSVSRESMRIITAAAASPLLIQKTAARKIRSYFFTTNSQDSVLKKRQRQKKKRQRVKLLFFSPTHISGFPFHLRGIVLNIWKINLLFFPRLR